MDHARWRFGAGRQRFGADAEGEEGERGRGRRRVSFGRRGRRRPGSRQEEEKIPLVHPKEEAVAEDQPEYSASDPPSGQIPALLLGHHHLGVSQHVRVDVGALQPAALAGHLPGHGQSRLSHPLHLRGIVEVVQLRLFRLLHVALQPVRLLRRHQLHSRSGVAASGAHAAARHVRAALRPIAAYLQDHQVLVIAASVGVFAAEFHAVHRFAAAAALPLHDDLRPVG